MTRTNSLAAGVALLASLALPARALDPGAVDVGLKLRASAETYLENGNSPFAAASALTGLGRERGRGEVELRLRLEGLTAAVAWRMASRLDDAPSSSAVLTELHYDAKVLGQRFTLGKKVMSWDVGFGFRPLDLIQQEDRRALLPFSLEGVPLLAWEHFGANDAVTAVWANPLRGRAPEPRSDESVALRYYRRAGPADLHAVLRWTGRTELQSGAALAVVLGDAVEVHGSFLHERVYERLVDARLASPETLLSLTDPRAVRRSRDGLSSLLGCTLTPGWDLSFLFEGWIDPRASTNAEWKGMVDLATRQRALLADPAVPREAVLANLAFGATFLDRPNLRRHNLLAHVSQRWDRVEPALDVLVTPEDGGWVATAGVSYQGERTRLELGVRAMGGPPGSAYRLYPERAIGYATLGLGF